MRKWMVPAVVFPVVVAAACGDDGGGPASADYDEEACSGEALDEAAADGPVEVVFWHAMTDVNAETLEDLVGEFNESQDRVEVSLLGNNGYREQQEKYRAGMRTGDMPDLVQHQEVFLQQLIDTETVLPVQACLEAEDYDLSDYVSRTVSYYEVEDTQWGMPFNVNTPVLLYDRVAFEDAGLDPDQPPETLEELQEAAEALRDSGLPKGMGLKRDGWYMEQFRALQGLPLVDNGNGRDGRAGQVVFDDDAGLEIFTALYDMIDEGLVETNPTEGPNATDNLLGLGAGNFGMTFDSSGTLGVIESLLGTGQFPDVDPGVAPLPGHTEDGGALFGGAGLYISAEDPAVQAATWEAIKFLTSPETQAVWAAETGFIPVRESSVDLPALEDRWSEQPWFRVAYDQLLEGADNEATAGPVIGDYPGYREIMEEILRRMEEEGLSPDEALDRAVTASNDAIATYNDRIEI